MGAHQEQRYRHEKEELLGGSVLVAIVNLLPHIEVVVCARVELKRHATDVMEHKIGSRHIGHVGQRPRRLLRYAGH